MATLTSGNFTRANVLAWLGETFVKRGDAYAQQDRVSHLTMSECRIEADVQGTQRKPYAVLAHISEAGLVSSCSCPVGGDCKHVAAMLLSALASRSDPERVSPGVLSWITDLKHLSLAVEKSRNAQPVSKQRLFYVLDWVGDAVDITVYKGDRPGNCNRWMLSERVLLQPPRFVDEEDLPILRELWVMQPQMRGCNVRLNTGKPSDLMSKILATGRLFADDMETTLAQGAPRPGKVIWQHQTSGQQHPVIVADPPATVVITTHPLWYVDIQQACVGPLELDIALDVLQKLLALPPLSQREAALVAEVLKEVAPQAPLPRADNSAPPRPIKSAPRGELRLDSLLVYSARPWRAHPGIDYDYAGHAFDYAEPMLCYEEARLAFDDPREFVTLPGGELMHIQRQPEAEKRLLASLRKVGFQAVPPYILSVRGQRPAHLYSLAAERDWDAFMQEGVAQLEATGWHVRYASDFRHHYLEVEAWDANVDETGGGWLDLDMGVLVAGERLPLAPMLSDLLHREPRWLDAISLADIGDDENVALFTEDGRRLRVKAERVKSIARLLIDLFDGYREGPLRLSRFDAARLDILQDTRRWQFKGSDAVLQLAERLRTSQGVRDIEPPKGLRLELRDYQRTGLSWLQYLREHKLSGILADDMGLGKTAQTLAHLLVEKEAGRLTHPALIVLPTSLVFNWKNEAARFAPDLKILSLHGQARRERFSAIPEHDVVLTTYPLLWRDGELLRAHEYHMLVLDEAQTVKNAHSKGAGEVRKIQTQHRLCLTGTPLENHLGELWTQFDFLLPGFLGDAKSFTRLWRNPIEKHGDLLRRNVLARRIRPFILRRKKDEVATELPPKTTIIRTVELVGAQRDLYETVRAAMDEKVRAEIAYRGFTRSQIVILDALLKLRQVCCDPRLVKSSVARKVKERAKLDLLMDMLPEMVEEGRRILVFSQFTAMLDLIQSELDAAGLKYLLLTGETKDRETPIQAFQAGEAPIFLISLKAGGVGLNLTAADTVIHYDPWWNPAVENQATDRAHRLGQDKPVFVYKLIAAGSIEEKILAMQEQKAELAAGILSDEHKGDVKFGEADIAALFEPLPR
ncbi:MAG: DEAD/DEAH box helicase [Zoogloeaceae bacterium]|jgi:superfamily II DNA or RNA helicase|nr:DEAD/DEAH box helicase [Zoogloeaceae bacterium]